MRALVVVLALLAATKVGTHVYLSTTAKTEIIIAAYRDRAVGACREAARVKRFEVALTAPSDRDVHLVIGRDGLDVALWQVDHAQWQARFKSPYLHLTMPGKSMSVLCEFDIVQDAATVTRM
ncbi:MAG: hypothetical protein AB7O57_19705 [Hyphomicrobiaceae bacterium]